LYGGSGYLLHTEPDIKRKHAHGGVELVQPRAEGELSFVAAAEVRASEELDWRGSRSYRAGFEFCSSNPRRVRQMLEHYRGHSPSGQFSLDSLRYPGLGHAFGFGGGPRRNTGEFPCKKRLASGVWHTILKFTWKSQAGDP